MADIILNLTGGSKRKILWDAGEDSPAPVESQTVEPQTAEPQTDSYKPTLLTWRNDPYGYSHPLDINKPCKFMFESESRTLKQEILANQKIACIKIIRIQTELGFKEAKDILVRNWEDWRKMFTNQEGIIIKPETQIVIHKVKNIPDEVVKSGNGHKSTMIRKLHNMEKDAIRAEFIKINGETSEDHWVAFRKDSPDINLEVAINQITGFVSYLHRDIAAGGKTANQLTNLLSYLKWLKSQYKLWAQYNSSKYEIYRQKNKNETLEKAMAVLEFQSGQTEVETSTGPKFAAGFPSKHKYA